MIDNPRIIRTAAQETAVIRLTIPRREMCDVMGPAIREVLDTVIAQGVTPGGPVFAHHFVLDPEIFDFEVGIPVANPISPVGRVQPGKLAPAQVARTVYRGPYDGLPAAWQELEAWIAGRGHVPAGPFREVYISGPERSADPAHWRTELNRELLEGEGER
ncbi:MAG: GyrI-like domain-containing protein [Acidobacteriota bacterium]